MALERNSNRTCSSEQRNEFHHGSETFFSSWLCARILAVSGYFLFSNSPDSNWHGSDQAYFSARIKTPIVPTIELLLLSQFERNPSYICGQAASWNPLSGHPPRSSVWSRDYFQLEAPCLLTESVSDSPVNPSRVNPPKSEPYRKTTNYYFLYPGGSLIPIEYSCSHFFNGALLSQSLDFPPPRPSWT